MTGRPKIALCLSGDPRCDIEAFPYISKKFLNNPNFDTDVYIHSWKSFESLDLYKPKQCLIESNQEGLIINQTLNQIKDKIEYKGPFKNNILMYYSIYKCFNLIKDKYDAVIRLRFDSYIPSYLNYNSIIKGVITKEYDMFIPKGRNESEHWEKEEITGYSDRIAIGNFQSMKIYSSVFPNIINIINSIGKFETHSFLYYILNKNNINVFNPYFYDGMLRENKKIVETDGEIHHLNS